MKLPSEVQHLCQKYLDKIKQDGQHDFADKDRLELYQSFGPSRLLSSATRVSLPDYTVADYVLCWLALLSAKKVAFILRRGPTDYDETEADEVRKILRTVEGYLNKRITFEEAETVLNEYWYFFRPHLTYDVLCAWRTSMDALRFTLYGVEFHEVAPPGFDGFTLQAVEAYTVTDYNLPGEGDDPDPPIPLEYDLRKRLKFWEWWLNEAIPQAWELTHQTS